MRRFYGRCDLPRPLRVQYPDAVYHVINRGNNRRAIFGSSFDYKKFMQLLEINCLMFSIQISAYCLMPNHYHLLVRTPLANLSNFMRRLNGAYAQYFNCLYGMDGHVFQGRYRAILVEKDRYLLSLIRYIHLNPLKAGLSQTPEGYPYSSHTHYLSHNFKSWMDATWALEIFSQGVANPYEKYLEWMNQAVEPEIERFYSAKKGSAILGSAEFKMKKGSDPRV